MCKPEEQLEEIKSGVVQEIQDDRFRQDGACKCNDSTFDGVFEYGCEHCSHLDLTTRDCWKGAEFIPTDNERFECWRLESGVIRWI